MHDEDQTRTRVWTADEVAARLKLNKSTVFRAVKRGTFPPPLHLAPRRIGFLVADIYAWLDSRRRINYGAAPVQNRPERSRKTHKREGAKE
jgi:predicted DNA-binding transcriptional regulator AlpA